jgi:hypothetical protein
MSYLNPLRLHFVGRFQAAPSTVNNDPDHYNNVTFQPSYQQLQGAQPNGWWNPEGDAAWRLFDCKVTTAWIGGAPAPQDDPIYSYRVADSDRTVAAKLVDLDPEQQLVSEIWGMQVRICRQNGTNLLRAHYRTAAFTDLWDRATGGGGDIGAGATYQSVLYDLEWGDTAASAFLSALRDSAIDGLLSIKFNVDGYNIAFGSPDFTKGRIAGTIGPASAAEPEHLVLGRHFMAPKGPGGNFFVPQGGINFCVATLDENAGRIYLDLGNALPTTKPGGPPSNLGGLSLGYVPPPDASNSSAILGIDSIPYLQPNWYELTAGIVALPASRSLTPEEIAVVRANPLALVLTDPSGNAKAAISEPSDGLYARADQYVFRLNPGDSAGVRIYATLFGRAYANARVICVLDPSQLQGTIPQGPVDFPARILTDANGVAPLPIRVSDPGNPRQYIDGQVYGIRPILEDTFAYGVNYPFNPWDFVSLLVFDSFDAGDPPTWYGSLQPVFQQYANLYPVMSHFLDLADYDSVCANAGLLRLAFGLPREDPNTMPVTRDLSGAKREAILRWLNQTGPDGKPLKGSPPPPVPTAAQASVLAAAKPVSAEFSRGGKAAAAARRLALRPKLR